VRKFPLGEGRGAGYKARPMTRPSIERWIKLFVVALVCTFIWTVWRVGVMLGMF
jgi:hypothetical protein